ncbi:hypothetical protein FA15DRAFT_674467 [Coprinopsis marcescibilis]|uniref:Protein artemis n=1 Tax=Coprinopsis marcescibilis TaxID=230819 RepID=A0A5C3KHD6_COPMA|nr:hypothetical protein FA15DRAFT_674467 [Coprinopsis marcescibilis]
MPTGTPYNACIPPYRIRVDDFASTNFSGPTPLLHLLTHTHSDHINGLHAKSFGHNVYCSEDAKQMLLRHEVFAERDLRDQELRAQKIRTFSHLKVDPLMNPDGTLYYQGSRDLLKSLPLHSPTRIELDASETVTITLLDANHCPGAVMILIEGRQGAVLHTGDFRAEPWFLDSLTRNPFLQPYLHNESSEGKPCPLTRTLEAIYLDTASVLYSKEVPTKHSATSGLVTLMKLFPETTYFFINTWTWGYEDVLKAVASAFQTPIHVDRYKHSIYQHISDPFLRMITTQDSSATRFHACERFCRCSDVEVENKPGSYTNTTSTTGKRVVYVNPVTMDEGHWARYRRETEVKLRQGERVDNLLVPLSRHSPLPELQRFVSMFRPRRVIPNTLDPRLQGLDWTCIDRMFAPCLHPSVSASTTTHTSAGIDALAKAAQEDGDVALKNLVGEGAEAVAAKWADGGKLLKKVDLLREYLCEAEHSSIDRLLGVPISSSPTVKHTTANKTRPGRDKGKASMRFEPISDEDTDCGDSEDERGRTAHKLFAAMAGIDEKENVWSQASSSPSQRSEAEILQQLQQEEDKEALPVQVASGSSRKRGLGKDGSFRTNKLITPVTTPSRPQRQGLGMGSLLASPLATKFKKKLASESGMSLASPIQLSSSPAADNFVEKLMNVPDPSPAPPRRVNSMCVSAQGGGVRPGSRPRMAKVRSASSVVFESRAAGVAVKPSLQQSAANIRTGSSKRKRDSGFGRSKEEAVVEAETPQPSSKRRKEVGQGVEFTPTPSKSRNKSRSGRNYTEEEKMEFQLLRLKYGERLAKAEPERVLPSYSQKREWLIRKYVGSTAGQGSAIVGNGKGKTLVPMSTKGFGDSVSQCGPRFKQVPSPSHSKGTLAGPVKALEMDKTMPFSFDTVYDEEDSKMDWSRSRELSKRVTIDLHLGRKPTLPALLCTRETQESLTQSLQV